MHLPTRIVLTHTTALAAALALMPAPVLRAQSTPAASPAASVSPSDISPIATVADAADPDRDEPVALERFVVAGVPVEDSVNPLIRPIGSVFGDARSILDTPRAVSSITQALIRERGIEGVREIVPYAPGASAPSSYGKATTPNIRGDVAETYLNGQRRGNNLYGFVASFNGVEAVDVVRGAAGTVYGAGQLTGGYVNYVTKQPQFTPSTTATLRLGTWVPDGGSFLDTSWQLDTTAPLADGKSAWRLSYEGKENDTFFRRLGARDDRQDIFASYLRRLSDTVTLEANVQYLWQAVPELLGVNRPTQELIDHGLYYNGQAADDAGFPGLIPATTQAVPLARDALVFSAGDFGNANVIHAQSILTAQLAPDRQLVSRSFVEHVDRRRYNAFEYAEWVTAWNIEQRTEYHAAFDAADAQHAVVAGVTVRYEDRLSYVNYFNEYFYQFDISDPGDRIHSHAQEFPNSYWPGFAGPGGYLFFPAAYGSPETTDSQLWNPAIFYQHEARWSDRFALLGGVRLDGFFGEATDPLPEPGSTAWHDTEAEEAVSWNVSATFHPVPTATLYATFQRTWAVDGNVTGGGLKLTDDADGHGFIDPANFKNESRLIEAGAKFALLDNQLFLGAAIFDQHRTEPELGGATQKLRVRGGELELVYQPTTAIEVAFNAAYLDALTLNSSPYQTGGRSLYDVYSPGTGPGGQGTGNGFTFDNQVPVGDWPLVGLSDWVLNASVSYRFPSGFGLGFTGSWQSEQLGNLDREYVIPDQLFLDVFLFYRRPTWEVNVDVLNVLDRDNWLHNGDAFTAGGLVFRDLPRRVSAYVKFKF